MPIVSGKYKNFNCITDIKFNIGPINLFYKIIYYKYIFKEKYILIITIDSINITYKYLYSLIIKINNNYSYFYNINFFPNLIYLSNNKKKLINKILKINNLQYKSILLLYKIILKKIIKNTYYNKYNFININNYLILFNIKKKVFHDK